MSEIGNSSQQEVYASSLKGVFTGQSAVSSAPATESPVTAAPAVEPTAATTTQTQPTATPDPDLWGMTPMGESSGAPANRLPNQQAARLQQLLGNQKIVFAVLALLLVVGVGAVVYGQVSQSRPSVSELAFVEEEIADPYFSVSDVYPSSDLTYDDTPVGVILPPIGEVEDNGPLGQATNRMAAVGEKIMLFDEEDVEMPGFPAVGEFGNLDSIGTDKYTSAQLQSIRDYGFVITPANLSYNEDPDASAYRSEDWIDLYGDIPGSSHPCFREASNTVMITSDLLLHVYHRLFDIELEYLEVTNFVPQLRTLTAKLLTGAEQKIATATDPDLRASYQRLANYLAIPTALLQSVNTDKAEGFTQNTPVGYFETLDYDLAETNLRALIATFPAADQQKILSDWQHVKSADTVAESAILGEGTHDYTQYTPRGHYNAHSIGQAYFISMMWLGRANFKFNTPDPTYNQRQAYDALNLVQLLADTQQVDTWRRLKEPIDYLVGNTDDLGYDDLKPFTTPNLKYSDIPAKLTQLQKLATPQIMSSIVIVTGTESKQEVQESTGAFALFSQRFTPDAYIYTTVTQGDEAPDPVTGERLPSSTTALAAAAALGNQFATAQVTRWVATNYPDSTNVFANRLQTMQSYFHNWTQDDWLANNYTNWLYMLASLESGQKPSRVDATAWQAKNLNAWLGSYTELKHDTVLYAKQAYAEWGGGGGEDCEVQPMPHGYVEENLEFFNRLSNLLIANQNWLRQSGLVSSADDAILWRLSSFQKSVNFYRRVVQAQQSQVLLTNAEYDQLRFSVGSLNGLVLPIFSNDFYEKDMRSALIADIFTSAPEQHIVYEANAIPEMITVLIDDYAGKRLVRGFVYNHYEFAGSLSNRWSDQDWWRSVYNKSGNVSLPAKDDWWQPYYGGK